jgi:hypothetical protein
MQLSDEKDVTFIHQPNRMVASRQWMMYAVLAAASGRWDFDLNATPEDGATKATLIINGFSISSAPTATYTPGSASPGGYGMGITASHIPGAMGNTWAYAEAYDLFWRRMEALLYKHPWPTCRGFYELNRSGGKPVEPICQNARDDMPENATLSREEFEILKQFTRHGSNKRKDLERRVVADSPWQ